MKTKTIPTFKVIFRRLAALAPLALLLAFSLIFPIRAHAVQNTDFIVENYNLTEHYSSLLSSECASYSSMDGDPQKQTSKSVLAAVNLYRKKLLDLQSHPDASSRLLAAEAELAYSQGLAIGRVAWIYHYNLASVKNESSLSLVSEEYSSRLGEIAAATDADTLDAHADVICREMNSLIYRKMIEELAAEGDSLASSSIIAGGLSRLGAISSHDLMGSEHAALYREILHDLRLQRTRDKLASDLDTILSLTEEGEDADASSAVALFTYKLKNAVSVPEMNSAMLEAIGSLISAEGEGVYSLLFSQELLSKLAEDCSKASKDGLGADLVPRFAHYRRERARASAKDAVYAMTVGADAGDAELCRIEARYNAEGGRLDAVSDEYGLELELTRARYTAEAHLARLRTDAELAIVLGKYDAADFLERTLKQYSLAVSALENISHGATFEKSCEAEFKSFSENMQSILSESKAERFLLDHRSLISKGDGELSLEDEAAARHALDDYVKLEREAAAALKSQISSICDKYCIILCAKMRSALKDDALYLDLCESLCEELRALGRENVALFYSECDLVIKKAQELAGAVAYYRSICADELYKSYNAEEREELVDVCRELADRLASLNVKDTVIFESELSTLGSDAKLDMLKTNESTRLRISAKGSQKSEIAAIVAQAKAKILASYDKSEILSISEMAIFKINRFLCAEHIDKLCEESKLSIKAMKFLSDAEKSLICGKLSALAAKAREDALVAENLTVLSFVWEDLEQKLESKMRESAALELERSRESYLALIEKEIEKSKSELRGMLYLTAAECDDFLNKSISLLSSFKGDIALADTPESSERIYRETLDILHVIKLEAEGLNLENYKLSLDKILSSMLNCKSQYSVENYNKVISVIEKARLALKDAGSLLECADILREAESGVELVSDLLDEAKQMAIARLEEKYSLLMQNSSLYSPSAEGELERILSEATRQINAFRGVESIPELERILALRLDELCGVRRDHVTNSGVGLDFISLGAQYPLNHDVTKELWGLITLPSAISSASKLAITPLQSGELSEVQSLLRRAVSEGRISFYGKELGEDELALLRKAKIALGVDIELSEAPSLLSTFNLQLLLPSSLREENILGVAFIKDDESVEFYNISQRDLLISLDLSHFSKYYIVSESTTDLTPLIIFLSILICLEFIILAVLLFVRVRRNRNKKRKEDDMFPLICASFVNPLPFLSLTKLKPEGAVTTVVLLSVAALALGCAVALMLKAELCEHRSRKERDGQGSRPLRSPEPQRLPERRRAMLAQKRYRLEAPKDDSLLSEPFGDGEENENEYAFCGAPSKSGSDFGSCEFERVPEPVPHSASPHRSKYEINLDVIADAFEAGDLVTLDALKRKRLIPKKTDHLKVLARGALSKPLVIEAHDFSRAAEDMLFALGGRAIRIKDHSH